MCERREIQKHRPRVCTSLFTPLPPAAFVELTYTSCKRTNLPNFCHSVGRRNATYLFLHLYTFCVKKWRIYITVSISVSVFNWKRLKNYRHEFLIDSVDSECLTRKITNSISLVDDCICYLSRTSRNHLDIVYLLEFGVSPHRSCSQKISSRYPLV